MELILPFGSGIRHERWRNATAFAGCVQPAKAVACATLHTPCEFQTWCTSPSDNPRSLCYDRALRLHTHHIFLSGLFGYVPFCSRSKETASLPPSFCLKLGRKTTLSVIYTFTFADVLQRLTQLNEYLIKLLSFRDFTGALGIACVFKTIQLLLVGDDVTIFFFEPIFTMDLSYLLLACAVLWTQGSKEEPSLYPRPSQ